jgi:RNA polymerase sigma-19 factor, ECF subfamily
LLTKKSKFESELIIGLKESDHNSFQKLFEMYSKPLFLFSMSYLKSKEDAEGVVQEVFIKIWKNRKELKTDTSFKSYLFTIALNTIRKHFNTKSRLYEIKHGILIDFLKNKIEIDDRDDFQFLLDKLDGFIQQMPEKRREVFIRKKIDGKTLNEISQELAISVKTVEYHITEAMKFLKKEFEKLKPGV